MKKNLVVMPVILCLLLTACQGEKGSKIETSASNISQRAGDAISSGKEDVITDSTDTSARSLTKRSDYAALMRMCDDLLAYVAAREGFYGNLLWVLDSFEAFDKDRTWENLLIARGIVDLAHADTESASFPDMQMTVEDEMELLKEGIDLGFLETARDSFNGTQENTKNDLLEFKSDTMEDVWLEEGWNVAMRKATVLKKMYEAGLQFMACMVEHILVSVGDKEVESYVRGAMQKSCPRTAALLPDTIIQSPAELEASGSKILDKIEELRYERNEISGIYIDYLYTLNDQIVERNYQKIGTGLLEIEGKPLTLLCPYWIAYENFSYYWTANGVPQEIAARTSITTAPNACRIEEADVAREEVMAYLEALEDYGLEEMISEKDAGDSREDKNISRKFRYEGGTLSAEYTDEGQERGTLALYMEQNPLFFADDWYFAAQKAAR